jgi:hypothetical protein
MSITDVLLLIGSHIVALTGGVLIGMIAMIKRLHKG